jgi:hypothetical protein
MINLIVQSFVFEQQIIIYTLILDPALLKQIISLPYWLYNTD